MKEAHQMEYNSAKEHLVIPEYGRNVQSMIAYAKTIENDEERQAFVEGLVDLMNQMLPQAKNVLEYKERLWKHVFRIANYELNVVPPNGEIPTPKEKELRPERMTYPSSDKRFKHYGTNVQSLIQKAIGMEDGDMKAEFVNIIASYMKLAFKTWNPDHYVNDEMIKQDIKDLSDQKLSMPDDAPIDFLINSQKKRSPHQNTTTHKRGSHRNNKGRSNNNNKYSNRKRR